MEVKQRNNETRKEYLLRVAIEVLYENAIFIDEFKYDDFRSDAAYLANELVNEFDIIR